MQKDDHATGLALVVTGVLVLTPDSLLIRLIDEAVWPVLVWRGFLQALGLSVILVCFYGLATASLFRAIGRFGFAVSAINVVGTFFFVTAITHTSTANALILIATGPFFAAIFSWLFLRESVPLRTWLAIAATLCGIAVLAVDSLGSPSLYGDLAALGTAICLGARFTLLRHMRGQNMIPSMVISGLIVGTIALMVAPATHFAPDQVGYALLMGLFVVPIAVALLTLGPRYLPAPEVSLLLLLETVLGPFWVWLVLDETPSTQSFIGGAIVVGALAVHSLLTRRSYMRAALSHAS